ncbi:hypothetical protein ACQ4M3_37320 [Leptolyngbya sp. AN03gr2]|uniref:hypothetical protein n=1 Tax=unclassified Leptolyngbya TaxID=2650499 RepID=UPI003D3167D2
MTPEEHQQLEFAIPSIVTVSDLNDQRSRTLLTGIDGYDNSFHVYLDYDRRSGMNSIHRLVWTSKQPCAEQASDDSQMQFISYSVNTSFDGRECIPFGSKWGGAYGRVMPHRSDFEFCKLLISRGIVVPFMPYDSCCQLSTSLFHGPIVKIEAGRKRIVQPDDCKSILPNRR